MKSKHALSDTINQVPCSLAVIMTFHIFISLVAFGASLTHPIFSHFAGPSNIFPCRFYLFPLVITRCASFSVLITWQKRFAWRLCILFYTYIFNLRVILCQLLVTLNLLSLQSMRFVAFSLGIKFLFCSCFEIVQALHPYIKMGSI